MHEDPSNLENHLRFTFAMHTAAPAGTFSVVNLNGYEAIGRPFSFTLTLAAARDKKIDVDQILNDAATLTIRIPGIKGCHAPYHGVLAEFDQLEKIDGMAFYRAVLVPRFARASLNRVSDVYLKPQTIVETLSDVLVANVFQDRNNDFQFRLVGKYQARESVCQYQESTFDFISRWLEKEGMYYYFEHEKNGDHDDRHSDENSKNTIEKMIVVDDTIKLPESRIHLHYRPLGQNSTNPAEQVVQHFICRNARLPKQVVLQDFNYRAATIPLRVLHTIPGGGIRNGDFMIYGEDFRTEEQGNRYARLRAEEIACGGARYFGDSTAVGLRSGYFMDLSDSPLPADASGKFLITEIEHRGSQAGLLLRGIQHPFEDADGAIFYRNSFIAIPGNTQFRPARTTHRPAIAGTMSAVVEANSQSLYANLDEKGQYNVQMPFVKQAAHPVTPGSARIRMASPYAGSNHGMVFPLHKGAEVLLSFINGDPDQPVIMNAVPNSANPSIVNNDTAKTSRIVSAGLNQITINDTVGNESIELKAPNGNGTALIGSTSGNAFFSKGNTNLITLGASNKIAIGPNNIISASTDTAFSISLASKIAMGASLTYTLGSDIRWNSPWSQTTSLDEGTTYSLRQIDRTQAGKEIEMLAGYNPEEAAELKALDILKTRIKKGIAAVTAINLLTGTAATVLTSTLGEKKNGKNILNPSTPINISTVAGNAGIAAISTATGVGVLHMMIKKLLSQYAVLTCASKMLLNNQGIEQIYKPNKKIGRLSRLSMDGVAHTASVEDDTGKMDFFNQLFLAKESSQLLAFSPKKKDAASLLLESNGAGILDTTHSLHMTSKKITVNDGASAMMKMQDGMIKIQGSSIDIGYTVPSRAGNARYMPLTAEINILTAECRMLGEKIDHLRLNYKKKSEHLKKLAPIRFSEKDLLSEAERIKTAIAECGAKKELIETKKVERAGLTEEELLHGFSVTDAAVQMQFDTAIVKATKNDLTLNFGGAGLKLTNAGASMQGRTINIG